MVRIIFTFRRRRRCLVPLMVVINLLGCAVFLEPSLLFLGADWKKEALKKGANAEKACRKLRTTMIGGGNDLGIMKALMSQHWTGNLFCEAIDVIRDNATDASHPIIVNISFGCKDLFRRGGVGTGNYISLVYGMRLATQAYENVGLHLTCPDAEATKEDLILPWLTGWFPPRSFKTSSLYPMVTTEQACSKYKTLPISLMYKEMQYDFRRMAIAMVGVPEPDHPSANFAKKYIMSESASGYEESHKLLQIPFPQRDADPIFPRGSVELDDAVIHFRCGDLMNSGHPAYGFMKFSGYTKFIFAEARSVGILTSPFDEGGQTRGADAASKVRNRCRVVVMSLVDYIQDRFPNARIRIHNGPNETIALTYARMIMANQTIVGMSSFGVFPVIAMFGTGYIRRPDYHNAPNRWLLHPPIDNLTDNVVLFEEPQRIMAGTIKRLWESRGEQGVLEWFWNDASP